MKTVSCLTKFMRTTVLSAAIIAGTAVSASAESAKDLLPEPYKSKGEITVAMVLDYPPYSWIDEAGKTTGLEVDVFNAVAEKLGIKANIVNAKWEGLITGVGGGRFDAGAGGTSDLLERQKLVTFADYATSSNAIIIQAANKDKYPDIDALCGGSIGVLKGTDTVKVGEFAVKNCADKGKPALTISYYSSVPDADLALKSGRDAAEVVSTEQAAFILSKGHQDWIILQAGVGDKVPMGPYTSVDKPELAKAFVAALTELKADGTLETIARKYGLEASLMDKPEINATRK